MQSDLRGAFRRGKYAAARRAFPMMTRGQVQSAIRRFVFDFDTANADIAADEVITPADEEHHIDKWAFQVPFFYGATRKQMISIRRSSTRNCRTEL